MTERRTASPVPRRASSAVLLPLLLVAAAVASSGCLTFPIDLQGDPNEFDCNFGRGPAGSCNSLAATYDCRSSETGAIGGDGLADCTGLFCTRACGSSTPPVTSCEAEGAFTSAECSALIAAADCSSGQLIAADSYFGIGQFCSGFRCTRTACPGFRGRSAGVDR